MCGIFGAVNLSGYFSQRETGSFIKATDLVAYRGPDAAGHTTIDVKLGRVGDPSHYNVFLGHRRLSILDLSTRGNQPMTDGAGLWITYNGEVYNYVELRRDLEATGHVFRSDTDTEVILKAYQEYGEAGFAKFNGMWAFAVVDLNRKRIVLSRDRFSVKPLYLLRVADCLYFASEVKQLLPFVPTTQLNETVLFDFLNQGLRNHGEGTFFKGISSLRPKHNMVINMEDGSVETTKYWDYTVSECGTFEDCVARFRELFYDSIRIRLRSDVPVATLVSGGVDSSAIAVGVQKITGGKLANYTAVTQFGKSNVKKFTDILRSHTGLKIHQIYIDSKDIIDEISDEIFHLDEPFGSFGFLAHLKMLDRIKQETDIKVVLDGQGADETLMGYRKFFFFFLLDRVHQGRYLGAAREVVMSLANRTVLCQFDPIEARRYWPVGRASGGHDGTPFLRLNGSNWDIGVPHSLRERQIADVEKFSLPGLTHYEDRNSMAHSIEIRLPFLDYRLVNLSLSIPPEWKIHNGWSKYILRKALPELPHQIRWRRDKRGYSLPQDQWLKDDLNPLVVRSFEDSVLVKMGLIDRQQFLESYEQYRNGSNRVSTGAFCRTLTAELWAKRFFT